VTIVGDLAIAGPQVGRDDDRDSLGPLESKEGDEDCFEMDEIVGGVAAGIHTPWAIVGLHHAHFQR
jgi:hypothetical protein